MSSKNDAVIIADIFLSVEKVPLASQFVHMRPSTVSLHMLDAPHWVNVSNFVAVH